MHPYWMWRSFSHHDSSWNFVVLVRHLWLLKCLYAASARYFGCFDSRNLLVLLLPSNLSTLWALCEMPSVCARIQANGSRSWNQFISDPWFTYLACLLPKIENSSAGLSICVPLRQAQIFILIFTFTSASVHFWPLRSCENLERLRTFSHCPWPGRQK